jgi:hypothetical protein
MDFISHNFKRTNTSPIDADYITLDTPLSFCIKRFLAELDRRYFNIMSFSVVKIPQVIIMMIAIELCVMFSENTHFIARKKLTKGEHLGFIC